MEPIPEPLVSDHRTARILLEKHRLRHSASGVGEAFIYAALVAVLLERMTAVACDLQLWADGAWFLIKVASTRGYYFWVGDWKREFFRARIFTILAEQTPLVLATHLRIHSLHVLSLIFGITLYSHALLSLYLCYRYAARRWYMLFPLLSFFAGTMNVEAYLATDSHFIVSLYWPALFILLFRKELTSGTLLLLWLLSVPMVLSYESMMFFGMVLAGVCWWRWRTIPGQKTLMATLLGWYLLGVALAVAAVIWPFDPSNKNGFLKSFIVLLKTSHPAAKVSVIVLICCAALLALPSRLTGLHKLIASAGLIAILYLWIQVLLGHTPWTLEVEVPARILNLLMPLAGSALLLLVLAGWLRPGRNAAGLAAILIGALGFGQAFWNLAAITRWQGMLATLRYELLLHEGPVAFEDSIMSRQLGPLHLRDLHAHWPLLPLSIYESGKGQIRSIILPEPTTYFPFDPFAPDGLPDLSRYGVRYDFYREALKRRPYTLGDTLTFSRGGSAAQFMRGNWEEAEDWATWGNGHDFGIDLPLSKTKLPQAVLLEATVAPNLAPGFPDLSVDVLINGVKVGTWSFHYPANGISTRSVEVPRAVLMRSDPAQIRFHIAGQLRSPSEMGTGEDARKLGLALVKLSLTGAP